VQIETFTIMLLILISLVVAGSIIWRLANRYPVNGENLLAVLWKDYIDSVRWLLRSRWALVLLALCIVLRQADFIFASSVAANTPLWNHFIPRLIFPAEWIEGLTWYFLHGWLFTYLVMPMMSLRPFVLPIRGSIWLGVWLALAGLWVFRRHVAKQSHEGLQRGIESFGRILGWTTVLGGLILVALAVWLVFGEDVPSLFTSRQSDPIYYWKYIPGLLSILTAAICAALFVSALFVSFRAHLDGTSHDRLSFAALRHCSPLFALCLCLALTELLLHIGQQALWMLETMRLRATSSGPIYFAGSRRYSITLAIELIYLAFLVVPAAIVADNISLKAAVKRNFSLWRTRPVQMFIAVVLFMAVAFFVHSWLTLIDQPFSSSWVAIRALRQLVSLLVHTSILLGVYQFYLRISERGTDSTNARQPITSMVRH